MIIKLDYNAVNKMLMEMLTVAKEVKVEIEGMEETVEELGIFWESESSCEYAMRINTDLYTAKAMLGGIKTSIVTLAELVERFDAAERYVRELIEGM